MAPLFLQDQDAWGLNRVSAGVTFTSVVQAATALCEQPSAVLKAESSPALDIDFHRQIQWPRWKWNANKEPLDLAPAP